MEDCRNDQNPVRHWLALQEQRRITKPNGASCQLWSVTIHSEATGVLFRKTSLLVTSEATRRKRGQVEKEKERKCCRKETDSGALKSTPRGLIAQELNVCRRGARVGKQPYGSYQSHHSSLGFKPRSNIQKKSNHSYTRSKQWRKYSAMVDGLSCGLADSSHRPLEGKYLL